MPAVPRSPSTVAACAPRTDPASTYEEEPLVAVASGATEGTPPRKPSTRGSAGRRRQERQEQPLCNRTLAWFFKGAFVLLVVVSWALTIGILVLHGVVSAAALSGTQLPTSVRGLSGGAVTITTEPTGMVHINASTTQDAFFAQGMVVAKLRLWQLEFQRRVGAGRLAEAVGKGALGTDKVMRTLGVYAQAQRAYGTLAPATKASIDAYTAGVNAFLDSNPELPIEFKLLGLTPEPWTASVSAPPCPLPWCRHRTPLTTSVCSREGANRE